MLAPLRTVITSAILMLCISTSLPAQSQTTGGIAGAVSYPTGERVVGAEVSVDSGTGLKRSVTTDAEGNYAFSFLPPGLYRVEFKVEGFSPRRFDVPVLVTQTAPINVHLTLVKVVGDEVTVVGSLMPNGPQLGRDFDSETISELPQASRNFIPILATVPGASVGLLDNNTPGRNSQNISFDGVRVTGNDFQLNGIDANNIDTNSPGLVPIPATEAIQEVRVQTSLADAAFGRGAGGSVQTITRSGGNTYHGAVYDYFRNESLSANDPFLKAAQVVRPILRRNVLGVIAGGPVRKDHSFFFGSYQAVRERNGASRNSRSNVPLPLGLTDDRSAETLMATFNPLANPSLTSAINPVSLALLKAKLPNGKFLIPTPQADGRYVGTEVSTYREDQFNINGDHQFGRTDHISVKFFYSNAPQFVGLTGGANVPGFGADIKQDNRLLSIQYVRALNSHIVNEARVGYSVIRQDNFNRQPVRDVDLGIHRTNAATYPGLGLISFGPASTGALAIGNAGGDFKDDALSTTLADTLSISRGKHDVRTGASAVFYADDLTMNPNRRGQIVFQNFNSFLIGIANSSMIADGINTRRMRAADYSFFLQDDWALLSRLTINLGLRYELDLPAFEKDGVMATFDPKLYKPRMEVDVSTGVPIGPPAGGVLQAGNAAPGLDLPEIPNVGKRLLNSIDPNNIAPRVGFAYVPPLSRRLAVRGGYGIFYSRVSTAYIGLTMKAPPFYATLRSPLGKTVPFADPYYPLPAQDKFPTFMPGVLLTGPAFDRGIRTPYFHQYNLSVRWELTGHLQFEAAYAGSRGLDLLRQMPLNQPRLASPQQPITNVVTGQSISTNSPDNTNVALRTPYPGMDAGMTQIQSSAQSTYNSLQLSLAHRKYKGMQFLASYTYSKSLDNASGGSVSAGDVLDTSLAPGNPLDSRANRGLSDFDRTHRFVLSYVWNLPGFADPRLPAFRSVFSNWQVSGIVSAMSGVPIDVVDSDAGSLYGSSMGRPNWTAGADRTTALTNIPPGYFFNPFAFTRPIVQANQLIPSSHGQAIANAVGTDFGDVGRNVLRGPGQRNVDIALTKRIPLAESKTLEFRGEFFNLLNEVNLANPNSNVAAASSFSNSGGIIAPADFGRIISTSSNPRLIQLALKLNW
jgi:hypothetical protein